MEPHADRPLDATAGEDLDLVRAVAQGSEPALASLYDRYAPTVLSVAGRLTHDQGVAEEVVQETFLALWNRVELFDPTLGTLGAWLATIARNRAVDRIRAAARRLPAAPFSALVGESDEASVTEWLVASGEVVGAAAPEPVPDVVLAANETRQTVASAIATLPPPERQTILLAYRDGLSQSEIATRLGWPLGTVKTRSRRALRQLRAAMERAAVLEAGAMRCCEAAGA